VVLDFFGIAVFAVSGALVVAEGGSISSPLPSSLREPELAAYKD